MVKFPLRNQKTSLNTTFKEIKERKAGIECENSQLKYEQPILNIKTAYFQFLHSIPTGKNGSPERTGISSGLQGCLTASSPHSITPMPSQTTLLNFCQTYIPKIPVQWSGNSSGGRKTLFGIFAPELSLSVALEKSFNISEHRISSSVK